MDQLPVLNPPEFPECFVCGPANAHGLHLTIHQDVSRVGANTQRVHVRMLEQEQVVVGSVVEQAVLERVGVAVADPTEPTDV